MRMLQLGGTLSNSSVRITPRVSWWITAQHLFSVNSVATDPNPEVDPLKNQKDENSKRFDMVFKHSRYKKNKFNDYSLIASAFKYLAKSKSDVSVAETMLNKNINSATTVDELLSITQYPLITKNIAIAINNTLCEWVSAGKVSMDDLNADRRYTKICRILNNDSSRTSQRKRLTTEESMYNLNDQFDKMDPVHSMRVLSNLAAGHKRNITLLESIAESILASHRHFNIKEIADILYNVTVLNFYHEELMNKVSSDLLHLIPNNTNSAIIGSILTSIGFLRYKDEVLLNEISKWISKNYSATRSQDLCSFLITLACLGCTTEHFDKIYESAIEPLKEEDMCKSSEWLDVVWSLTILDKATFKHYNSVLNKDFLSRIIAHTDQNTSKISKLLNIDATARLLTPDYKGSTLPDMSSILKNVTRERSKDKINLANCVISALKILLPSDSIYLNVNIDSEMGFLFDAEFCVDSNCKPLPIYKSEKDKHVFRIAILSCNYHEFCRKNNTLIGPVNLYKKLLDKKEYKVLLIPYTEVNSSDKLVTRVKYINDNLKSLVQSTSTQ